MRERESTVNYIKKERHTGGLGGQKTTFKSCQNATCSNEFFSPVGRRVDYG